MRGASNVKRALAFVGDLMPAVTAKTCATAEGTSKKGRFYKPLPKQFCRDGFQYRQVTRELNAAIYEQTWNGCRDPAVCFEVIRVKRRDSFEIAGRFIPPAEVYSRSEQWGDLGWTVPDKGSAFCKLRELVNARKKENRRIP
jgi:hypothetical protein